MAGELHASSPVISLAHNHSWIWGMRQIIDNCTPGSLKKAQLLLSPTGKLVAWSYFLENLWSCGLGIQNGGELLVTSDSESFWGQEASTREEPNTHTPKAGSAF